MAAIPRGSGAGGTGCCCESGILTKLWGRATWARNSIEIDHPQLWPTYQQIIAEPMDLRQVRTNLEAGLYQPEFGRAVRPGFRRDVRLICTNAMQFNAPGSDMHKRAKKLLKKFSKWVKRAEADRAEADANADAQEATNAPSYAKERMILSLLSHPTRSLAHWGLQRPVEELFPESWHHYKAHVQEPMDLGTIGTKLQRGQYDVVPGTKIAPGFVRDLRLVFENAKQYNRPGSHYHEHAIEMLGWFESNVMAVTAVAATGPQNDVVQHLAKKRKTCVDCKSEHDRWRHTRYDHWQQKLQPTEPGLGVALLQLSLCSLLHSRLGAEAPVGLNADVVELIGAAVFRVVGTCGVLMNHTERVNCAGFSPDGSKLFSASWDMTLRVWDATTGVCQRTLGHHHGVSSACFSLDGSKLVSASGCANRLRVWDVATGVCQQKFTDGEQNSHYTTSVSLSLDGTKLVSASTDKSLRVWDVAIGACERKWRAHLDWVRSAHFSPDGAKLVSASDDKTLRVWDVATGECQQTLKGHTGWVRSASFSPDGAKLVSASGDKTLRVWDVATGECQQTLNGHTGSVTSACFSPDGATSKLVSASCDKTLRIWDVVTGECQQTLKGHTDSITSACFSPDGAKLVSASWDKTVHVWRIVR